MPYFPPPAGGSTPASTVTSETAWGISPSVGTGTAYARDDHTHGTATDPTTVISYSPASVTVDNGTLITGSHTDLVSADATYVQVQEGTGATPLTVRVGFTGVIALDNLIIYGRYDGGSGHQVAIELYNVGTTNYDVMGIMTHSTTNGWYALPIVDGPAYINSGAVTVRFRHLNVGNISHNLYLDLVKVRKGGTAGAGVTEHGSLTGLADDDHTQYHNDTRGDARYALVANGVTNGDSHNHSGGDGAQIAYSSLSGLPTIAFTLQVAAPTQTTTTDGQTLYWGAAQLAQSTIEGGYRLYIPVACTLTIVYIHMHAGTAGSNENWSLYIRKNATTDVLIQTLASASTNRVWSNTGLSISFAQGDWLEIKEVQPTWGTNPANVRRMGTLYFTVP